MTGYDTHLTADAWRDAFALVAGILHDDAAGQDAVLANAEPVALACALAAVTGAALTIVASDTIGEGWALLTDDQRADLTKATFVHALRGVAPLGVPVPPMPASIPGDGLED